MSKKQQEGVLGVYGHLDTLADCLKTLKEKGFRNIRVFSPVPSHEIEEIIGEPESPVRFFTLIGALLGGASGVAFTTITASDWPIQVSAKPVVSILPFMVIIFELTILIGALATLMGLLINSLLRRRAPVTMYDPRFSDDKFGLMVVCPDEKASRVAREIMLSGGAEEVKFDSA
ncbi:MAG: DUF3341 domain-containing protein [Candidatus Mycalebacterium zealandia]|nr:MAG: DUF3341 domain-containing protein [Candidatus Mycalebacterium zealandia]